MNLFFKIIIGHIIFLCLISCNNSKPSSDSEILNKKVAINFPNKDSELAILMRELFNDSKKIKQQIQEGENPEFFVEFTKLHSAVPTDSTVREDGVYTSFADIFINSVEDLLSCKINKTKQYNFMIQKCLDCHKQICPGPVKKIKKLLI